MGAHDQEAVDEKELKIEDQTSAVESQSIMENKKTSIEAFLNVNLEVRVVLGRARMPISQLLELEKGSVVELDRKIGDPVDVMINDRLVAKADLIKVEGEYIGIALREIVKEIVAEK